MPIPNNYEVITTNSSDASIRVDIVWPYESLDELFIWVQDTITGTLQYFTNADFTVTQQDDETGEYILVENNTGNPVVVNTARRTDRQQLYTLSEAEALDPVAFIKSLDQQVKMIQEILVSDDQSLQTITSPNPFVVPDKVTRAGKVQTFDDNGDPLYETIDEALQDPVDYATEWANKAEDSLISASAGGDQVDDYSALHHANKASDSASAASTSESNAGTSESNASTSESNAGTSASNAQLREWEAKAEVLTAESYATQPEDMFVFIFTSNGDGTFTVTQTTEYSAFHWAKKSESAIAADPYGVKAYVRFSGANPAVILDSVGVGSVTHVGTGLYDIVFTSGVFNTTDYVHTSGGALSINAPDLLFESLNIARTTTTIRFRSLNNNGDINNAEEGILVFFGGQ